ncbi:DNA-binding response regulator, OmpR family, contains REC and winged-helix (wHTH) domain [Dyella jiangningensis]|uniref:response regulator n=1 Tax=Dyella sp. AtDHG13 TaxID=1938897 RepID=UPI000889C402|nr:response regulator [Dyella sp. AtDHG13]PXV59068.1 two-component system response regulator QseB [Dyella sp. AtDHG13]SDL27504.1 DNA-binding response regulator, OmpR family, contains REC and winged-helix (wHTH) domain [Dyella jiangningensis]
MHIILVEDDLELGAAIQRALERLSYTVTWLTDGTGAIATMQASSADLVLLDLGLPGQDGLDILTEARNSGLATPVLILTARDAVQARIHGLDAGADDYLTKPFHLDELAARIRSLTRRMQGLAANRIEVGALCLDLGTLEVSFRGNKVDLTRRELSLLQALMERSGRVVRRDTLESSLYGGEKVVTDGALDVLVHSLRRKLSFDTIQNVRAFGYMIPRDAR